MRVHNGRQPDFAIGRHACGLERRALRKSAALTARGRGIGVYRSADRREQAERGEDPAGERSGDSVSLPPLLSMLGGATEVGSRVRQIQGIDLAEVGSSSGAIQIRRCKESHPRRQLLQSVHRATAGGIQQCQ